MSQTKKIVFTVFCLAGEEEDVSLQLFNPDTSQDSFFYSCDNALASCKVEILDPTPEEDAKAAENLDLE